MKSCKFQYSFVLIFVLLAIVSGCSTPGTADARPSDFNLAYEWQEGSLPPPFHYEYTITVGPSGQGEIAMTPDYPGDNVPVWKEAFTVAPTELDNLFRTLVAQGLFTKNWESQSQPPVGGSSQSLVVTANGRQVKIPTWPVAAQDASAANIFKAINALVPQTLWDKLEGQREQYMAEHR